MKFVNDRPFADPDAARKLVEIANSAEVVQDGRIHIDALLNADGTQPNTALASSARSPRAGCGA